MKNTHYLANLSSLLQPQLDLINSLQPQLDLIDSLQPQLDFAESFQQQISSASFLERVMDTSSIPLYDRQALFQSIEPICALQDHLADPFDYIQRYNIETDSLSALAERVSLACENISLPTRLLYESAQSIASATQILENLASSFAYNIEAIHISSGTETTDYIDLPQPVAELISDIDNSIELPSPDSEHVVRVRKLNHDTYLSVISILLTLISLFYGVISSNSSANLSKQQHKELMQQNQQQHKELLLQDQQQHAELMQEERRQTELLEQMCNALDAMLNSNSQSNESTEKREPCQSTTE